MSLSRRELIKGRRPEETHISSLVVHCHPDHLNNAIETITALPGVEVPEHDPQGKLVVVMETPDQGAIVERLASIESVTGVIAATLVYHQVEAQESQA